MIPAMKTTVLSVFVFLFVVVVPTSAHAQADIEPTIEALRAEIERLQGMVVQRQNYFESGPTTDEPAEYFNFVTGNTPEVLFEGERQSVSFTTDLDVQQVLLVTDCATESYTKGSSVCSEESWLISTTPATEWSHTFDVDIAFPTNSTDTTTYDVYACRWNGCMLEDTLTFTHKPVQTFADQVHIFDRGEWEYPIGNELIHEQEVLLRFPAEEVKYLYLETFCEDRRNFTPTYDASKRISCDEERRYAQPEFRDVLTDEAGNEYNLLLISATDNMTQELSGSVELQFRFVSSQNATIATVSHWPEQKEEVVE